MKDSQLKSDTRSWNSFHGPNLGYIAELYDEFLQNPERVDVSLQNLFRQWGDPIVGLETLDEQKEGEPTTYTSVNGVMRAVSAYELLRNVSEYGHLLANISPMQSAPADTPELNPASYGLTEADLAAIPAKVLWANAPAHVQTGLDAYRELKQLYTGPIAYEFAHVHEAQERDWLRRFVESKPAHLSLSVDEKQNLLERLTEVEEFETFLHRTFVGQKRFSIEGVDALVPMMDDLVEHAVHTGAKHVMIGMAHRGRLNVLAHVLGKPYAKIFSEFHTAPNKDLVPSEGSMGINFGWTGDVKYHLGAKRTMVEGNVAEARLVLANNPSHLEFVNPVVEGFARAAQDDRQLRGMPKQDVNAALAIIVHGDAAFPGEGIVAETLNLSHLAGYSTGGTIHIIANNLLGFTAESKESRSTRYASDLAKGFEIPIVHVNADDPEACLFAVRLAYAYRAEFHKDFLIDLIGYRRWGHNEMDDPSVTQPDLYEKIHPHPRVRELYAKKLLRDQIMSEQTVAQITEQVQTKLRNAYNDVAKEHLLDEDEKDIKSPEVQYKTAVDVQELQQINRELLQFPSDFTPYPKLHRILERRTQAFEGDGTLDWGHAETMAFASILADGTPIRLTGQDSERGTFSHRNIVLHDVKTNEKYCPLHGLSNVKVSFDIHNSPLSEAGVLGFEYGYNVHSPETLVIWEAQFGDFANAGQVIIDQFIASGIAKWQQPSGLIMLLPHGYEGQGPEHSSARLERYLTLSAENNWRIVNATTSAQYFHILRDQAKQLKTDPKPLVMMTPKSLLRNPRAASHWQEFASGKFEAVLQTEQSQPKNVKRVVICSGKVAVDLEAALEEKKDRKNDIRVIRLEQLYPFPDKELKAILQTMPKVQEVIWVQEEPRNMGAWFYVRPRIEAILPTALNLEYCGRPERSSPAEGMAGVHNVTQHNIVETALRPFAQ